MKVYVIAKSYEFEGYGEPLEAFVSKTQAEAWVSAHPRSKNLEIFELDVQTLTNGELFKNFPIGQKFYPPSGDSFYFIKISDTGAIRFRIEDDSIGKHFPDMYSDAIISVTMGGCNSLWRTEQS